MSGHDDRRVGGEMVPTPRRGVERRGYPETEAPRRPTHPFGRTARAEVNNARRPVPRLQGAEGRVRQQPQRATPYSVLMGVQRFLVCGWSVITNIVTIVFAFAIKNVGLTLLFVQTKTLLVCLFTLSHE